MYNDSSFIKPTLEIAMKITRLISILVIFVLLLSFVSCDQINFHNIHGGGNNQSQSGENEESQGGEGEIVYVYSVLSKVIHMPGCYHIDRIKEDYLKETTDIAPLFEKDYTICKDCFGLNDKEPEEEEEDDTNKVSKEDATFIINASTKKMHELDCYHTEGMVEENLEYSDLTLEELLALEYIPCKTCMPDQAKEYEKTHSEE